MKNEKKNIDRLFQEKFRDFEAVPDERIWENIKNELQGEKDRPAIILPIWLKLSGVAAALVVLLAIGSFWKLSDSNTIEVVNQENPDTEQVQDIQEIENPIDLQNTVQPAEVSTATITDQQQDQESIAIDQNSHKSNSKKKPSETQSMIAATSSSQETFSNEIEENNLMETENAIEKSQNLTEISEFFAKLNWVESHIENDESIENTQEEDSTGKSIWEDIAKNEKEDEIKELSSTEQYRMAIRPNISPIYYNSISGGSAVEPMLAGSKVKAEVTMSYGVDISYAINDKIKVRAGVNKVSMSYNTPDIAVVPSSSPNGLTGVQNPNAQYISVVKTSDLDQKALEMGEDPMIYSLGRLGQQMEYIEVPMEVEFALLKTRFGINLIGGASTLFLSDDMVKIYSEMGSTELGRASNLNNLSFTTNLGVGFAYDLTDKLNLNVEPTFKYQIGAHSGDVGGFKPYYFGMYSGLSFKF